MKKNALLLLPFILLITACNKPNEKVTPARIITAEPVKLDLSSANTLIDLPLACILQEYPNKLNQVLGDKNDLQSPKDLL